MPLAPSRASRQEQLRVDTVKKVRLERSFVLQLKPYFRRIAKDMETEYRRNGTILSLNEAQAEINVMLRGHYRKVQNKFKKSIQNETFKSHGIQLLQFKQDLSSEIDIELAQYRVERAPQEAGIITETTNRDLTDSFMSTLQAFSESNIRPTNAQVAVGAAVEFNRRSQGRTETISQTETQNSAEATKDIEAAAIIAGAIVIGGALITQDEVIKTWSTLLDTRTRISHVLADDQQVPESKPFVVQGQLLMYPGDESLGASLDNLINCRCNSSRIIDSRGELPGAIPQSGLDDAFQPRAIPINPNPESLRVVA